MPNPFSLTIVSYINIKGSAYVDTFIIRVEIIFSVSRKKERKKGKLFLLSIFSKSDEKQAFSHTKHEGINISIKMFC